MKKKKTKPKLFKWRPPKKTMALINALAEHTGKTPDQVVHDIIEEAWREYKKQQ